MAGKSITDAQAAQAAHKTSKAKAKTLSTTKKTFMAITGLNGKMWYVDPTQLGQLPASSDNTLFAGIAFITPKVDQNTTEIWEHAGFMAHMDESHTNIDWDQYASAIKEHIMATDVCPVYQQKCNPVTSIENIPFLVDSGATVHIFPCRNDFQTL